MKDTRIKLDSSYYTLEAIKRSEKFKLIKNGLVQKYDLPVDGFKKIADYEQWQDKQIKKNILTTDIIKEVLGRFNIDINNEKLQFGLKWILFFNKPPVVASPINYLQKATKGGNVEISLNIFPWATKEDFYNLELWKTVEQLRKDITKTPAVKNKDWDNFKRDLQVFSLYQQAEKDIAEGQSNRLTPHRGIVSKSIYEKLKTYKSYQQLVNEFGDLDDQLGFIISRCKRHFGSLQLL